MKTQSNGYKNRWKNSRIKEWNIVSDEKKELIRGLYEIDPERYYQARLGRIFSVSRQYVEEVLRPVDNSLDK